jgi:hypothetical protein
MDEPVVTFTFVREGEPIRNPIDERCQLFEGKGPCKRIIQEDKCQVFGFPQSKWKVSVCPMATHVIKEVVKEKQRVGQQKQKIKHR